jgi:hypothetical protein
VKTRKKPCLVPAVDGFNGVHIIWKISSTKLIYYLEEYKPGMVCLPEIKTAIAIIRREEDDYPFLVHSTCPIWSF